MNIDLLRDKFGQFGLVCDQGFEQTPKAALFDPSQGVLSLEFDVGRDALVCNVAVVEEWRTPLSMEDSILIGAVSDSFVQMAERIPIKSLL